MKGERREWEEGESRMRIKRKTEREVRDRVRREGETVRGEIDEERETE